MKSTPQVLTSARLAEILVARGMLGPDQRDWALAAQARSGSTLPKVLITSGLVKRREMYQVLAEQCGVPFIDLTAESLDQGLLARLNPRQLICEDWVPVRSLPDGSVLVAGQQVPWSALLASIARALGCPVTYRVTTDRDIRYALQHGLRDLILDQTVMGLRQRSGVQSARQALYAQRRVGLILALGAVIAAIIAWPIGTLQAASAVITVAFLYASRPGSPSAWWSAARAVRGGHGRGLGRAARGGPAGLQHQVRGS
jgi:glycosyltransferase XagB